MLRTNLGGRHAQAEFNIPLVRGENNISLNFSKYHQEEGGRSLAVLMEDISLN